MKTKIKAILFGVIALFLPAFNLSAQVLENIPGQTSAGSSNLIGYLDNLYKFGISITGILAVFMIALGAFSYIVTSAGNSSKMMNAKEMINNALIGLVIVLTAYLFLYVINPDLVGGTLKAPEEAINGIISSTTSGGETYALNPGDDCQGTLPGPSGTVVNSEQLSCTECEFGSVPKSTSGSSLPNTLVCDDDPVSAVSNTSVMSLDDAITDNNIEPNKLGCCEIPGSTAINGGSCGDASDGYTLEDCLDTAQSENKYDDSKFDTKAICQNGVGCVIK